MKTKILLIFFLIFTLTASAGLAADTDLMYYSELNLPSVKVHEKLPSEYDMRKKGWVTSCKDQGWYGTCWAFAATSAAETSLLKKNLVKSKDGNKKNTADYPDLSELQLAYFLYNRGKDAPPGTKKDKIISATGDSYLDAGGEAYQTTFALASWTGAVTEKKTDADYNDADKKTKLNKNLEYLSDFAHLQNAWWVKAHDRSSVKSMILKHGSPIICYYSGYWDYSYHKVSGTSGTDMTYYNPYSWEMPDHEVVIIGWDDDYPAGNFSPRPPGNGAWLVKNSWGSSWGNDGCFWLSYYDAAIDDYAVFLDFEKADDYQNIYQYDGGGSTGQDLSYGNTGWMSNVFASRGKQTINAVSFFAEENADLDYSIQIYTGIADKNDPASGRRRLSVPQKGTTTYAGYYTVPLDEPVRLSDKETFSIVIKLHKKGKEDVYMPVDTDATRYGWVKYDTSAGKGQSFVSADGHRWKDISADGSSNIRIKAFTDESRPLWWLYAAAAVSALLLAAAVILLCRRSRRKKKDADNGISLS